MWQCGQWSIATNIVTKQGILTSNKFLPLLEVSYEDNSVSSEDDLSSYSGNSNHNCRIPTRTIVSVTSLSTRVPTASSAPKTCVELPDHEPWSISKTQNDEKLSKISLKGNKNKTGYLDRGSEHTLALPICYDSANKMQHL